jgi:hypothetical protein
MRSPPVMLLLLCCLSFPAAAQLPSDDCRDRSGLPVRGIVRNDMPWAGAATELNGESVIYWNQSRNSRASLASRLFIYMHECAHHVLGHVWKSPSPRWEAEADCWAVQALRERSLLRAFQVRQLEQQVWRSRSGAGRFAEGSRRAFSRCLDIKTDRDAWARALDALAAASADSFRSVIGQAVPRPGARSGVHESELDVPGTYDCEVTSTRDVRCTVFTATSERGLLGRHRALDRIVRRWLPPGWTPVEAAPSPGLLRRLEVSDSIGPRLTLSATRRLQLVFVMHPAPRDPDAILPPERIQFRVTYLDSARAGRGSATTY